MILAPAPPQSNPQASSREAPAGVSRDAGDGDDERHPAPPTLSPCPPLSNPISHAREALLDAWRRVMYGDISMQNRLEFTAIGDAANAETRIESMCKTLQRNVLVSGNGSNR